MISSFQRYKFDNKIVRRYGERLRLKFTFNGANENDDEVGIGVQLGGMLNTVMYFVSALCFLEYGKAHFDGRKFSQFVANVERSVKYKVPENTKEKISQTTK